MDLLQETSINCPYCAEVITILVDGSVERQEYIEDCEVCCRPMHIRVIMSTNGSCQIDARDENS